MYAVDFDEKLDRWILSFIHVTTSAYRESISKSGIVKIDLNSAIDSIFERYPKYSYCSAGFRRYVADLPLGPAAREAEAFEGKTVVYSTYFLNVPGIEQLLSQSERLVSHGGEVYSTVVGALREYLATLGIAGVFPGIYNETDEDYYIVRYKFPRNYNENVPLTANRKIRDLLDLVKVASLRDNLRDILEVQFLRSASPGHIYFRGTREQLFARVQFKEMISPSALERL